MPSLVVIIVGLTGGACARPATPAAPADNPQLVLGQQIWSSNCASCHGTQGQGGRGTKLNEGSVVAMFPNVGDQVKIVTEGKGAMPRFNNKLTPEQINAVVAYTREVL